VWRFLRALKIDLAGRKSKMHQRRVKNESANCDFQVRVNMLRDIWRGFNRQAIGLPLTLGPPHQ
jgi:hypothetical protein